MFSSFLCSTHGTRCQGSVTTPHCTLAALAAASCGASSSSSNRSGQWRGRPELSAYLGIMQKCTCGTSWPAAAPLFCSTLYAVAPVACITAFAILGNAALAVTRSSGLRPGYHGGPLYSLVGLHAVSHLVECLEGENRFLPVLQHITLSNKYMYSEHI